MKLSGAVVATLRSRRFWIWQAAGAIIYAIPVIIRYTTGNVEIPLLNWPGVWYYHLIPGNLLEKIFVNAFFPGGAGAIAGELLVSNYKDTHLAGKPKYSARLLGALGETALWSAFQFSGYFLMIAGPSGADGSNLFESVFVFPINFVIAALSIFTPDAVDYVRRGITWARAKFSGKKQTGSRVPRKVN